MFIIFRNIHAHFVIFIIIYTLKPLVSFSWTIHPPIYASVKASKLRQGTHRFQRNISPRQNPEIDEWCENSKLRQSLATLTQKNRWDPFTASKAWDIPSHWSWSWQSRVGSQRMLDALNLHPTAAALGFRDCFQITSWPTIVVGFVFVDGQLHNAIIGLGFVTLQNLQISMYKSIVYTNAKKR